MNIISIFMLKIAIMPGQETSFLPQHNSRILTSCELATRRMTQLDTLDGEVKRYYKSGKLREVAFYASGSRSGVTTTYNPNGSLNYEAMYKAGKLDGLFRQYKKGHLAKQIMYANGLYNGEWIAYRNGHKVIEVSFKMGRLDGWYYDYYYGSGRIQRKAFYRDGEIVSGEYLYGEDGYLKYELISDKHNNHLIEQVFYDKNGKVIGNKFIDKFPITKYLF